MASSSKFGGRKKKSFKPRKYGKVERKIFLEEENLYELRFDEVGSIGCTFSHHRS